MILEQEGDVIKMAFAEDYFSNLQRNNCTKEDWNQDHQQRSDCNPCVNRTDPKSHKKGENDEYVRYYEAKGFKVWFLNH